MGVWYCQPSLPGPPHSHRNSCQPHSPTGAGASTKCSLSIPECQPFLTSDTLDAGFLTSSRAQCAHVECGEVGGGVSGWEEDRIPVSCPNSLNPRR